MCTGRIILFSVAVMVTRGLPVTTGPTDPDDGGGTNVGDTVAWIRNENALRHDRDGTRRDGGRGKPLRPTASRVTIARNGQPDDTPCLSVVGPWLSTNLETVFEVSATSLAGRLNLRAVGSDWKGSVETLFGDGGPLSAVINQPASGTVATFVGHCRTVNGVDSITGTH